MRYDLAPVYSEDEFCHWLMPRPNIIDCYVVERSPTAEATSKTNGTAAGGNKYLFLIHNFEIFNANQQLQFNCFAVNKCHEFLCW